MHAGEGRAMRPPPAPCPNDRQGQPRNAFAQALGCGAGGRRGGVPAYRPASVVRAATTRWRTTHASRVTTRHPPRQESDQAGGRVIPRPGQRGQGQGVPLGPARALSTRYGLRSASPACASDSCAAGALVASTRQPRRPMAVATAWRATTAFTPGLVPPAPSRVGCHRAAAGAPARVRCTAPPAARAPVTGQPRRHRRRQPGHVTEPRLPTPAGVERGHRRPRPTSRRAVQALLGPAPSAVRGSSRASPSAIGCRVPVAVRRVRRVKGCCPLAPGPQESAKTSAGSGISATGPREPSPPA